MPSRLIDYGGTSYPTVKDRVELSEGIGQNFVDGFINELKHYPKRPGLTLFASTGTAFAIDALYRTVGKNPAIMIAVCNGAVYRVNSNGTVTAFTGSTLTAGNPCCFTEDVNFVYVAHGDAIAKLDVIALTVVLLTGGNAPTLVTQIAFTDNFLVCNGQIGGGGVAGDLNYSDDNLNGYIAADSWEVFNNEALGDSCTAVAVQWQELFCFGPESVEVSYDDGESPFARLSGGVSPYGIMAPFSLLNVDNTLYFLSRVDGAIRLVRLEGRRPVLASEQYDRQLQGLTTLSSGRAFLAVVDGKPFYCIGFGGADNVTYVFNLRTRTWSQWGLWNGATYDQFAGQCSAYWPEQNKFLIGDRRTNGRIYTFTGLTDNGTQIRYELTSNVHRWGTLHNKEANCIVTETKRGQGINAQGTLTSTGVIPADNDTVTIGATVYRFKTVLVTAFDVLINGSAANALINLKKAINLTGVAGTDYGTGTTVHPTVLASTITATTLLVEAKVLQSGTAGNSIVTTETSLQLSWGGGTLSGASVFKFRYRNNGLDFIAPFRQLAIGNSADAAYYNRMNRCGTYRSRQYQVVHDDINSDFILVNTEEWMQVLAH